jgi:hypothetical protein
MMRPTCGTDFGEVFMEAFALPKFGNGGKIIKQDISGRWPGPLIPWATEKSFLFPK